MASDLNLVALEGRLGMDASVKNNGIFFTMASNESYKDRDGEWQEKATWAAVNYYRTTDDRLVNALTKGTKVRIEGKLNSYVEKTDSGNRTVLNVKASTIEFVYDGRKKDNDSSDAPRTTNRTSNTSPRRTSNGNRRRVDDDVDEEGGYSWGNDE